jgi:hypothetical protein
MRRVVVGTLVALSLVFVGGSLALAEGADITEADPPFNTVGLMDSEEFLLLFTRDASGETLLHGLELYLPNSENPSFLPDLVNASGDVSAEVYDVDYFLDLIDSQGGFPQAVEARDTDKMLASGVVGLHINDALSFSGDGDRNGWTVIGDVIDENGDGRKLSAKAVLLNGETVRVHIEFR